MTAHNNAIVRINPRSTGITGIETYEKHTIQKSLEPEARELARCQRLSLATKHVRPAQLLDFDKTSNRLTTRRIEGDELFHTLWNSSYLLGRLRGNKSLDPVRIIENMEALGRWLKLYHESSRARQKNIDGSWLIEAFHQKLQDARDYNLLPEQTIRRIESRFEPELQRLHDPCYLSGYEFFQCTLHGDFVIYNIMVDANQTLHVLDFGDTRESVNLEDVARLYSSLWAISETSRFRKRLLGNAAKRMLLAYGYELDVLSTPYFKCNLAYNFLTHLSGQFHMKHLLSWNSYREMNQITKAGLRWIDSQL